MFAIEFYDIYYDYLFWINILNVVIEYVSQFWILYCTNDVGGSFKVFGKIVISVKIFCC